MDTQEYLKLRGFLQANLSYGIELERNIPTDRERIERALHINRVHNNQIFEAQRWHYSPDGSVITGHEVKLRAEPYTFKDLHKLISFFEAKADSLGAIEQCCQSTSNHITFVLPRKKLPFTLIGNIVNLTKAYTLGLKYLTSGCIGSISRKESYGHYCEPHLNFILMPTTIIPTYAAQTGKYSICNINKCEFIQDAVLRFRVEFRETDGIRVPSALAALVYLHKAIILKALDLSLDRLYNPMELRDADTIEQTHTAYNIMARKKGVNPSAEMKRLFKADAVALIDLLEPILKAERDSDYIIAVLRKLAESNISERLAEKRNLDIEKDLMPTNFREVKLTKLQQELIKVIVSEKIEAASITEAKAKLADRFGCNERTIRYAMLGIEVIMQRKIGYDSRLSKFIIGAEE